MNAMQCFVFEGRNVRMVLIEGEPWFVAKDVCGVLEVGNTSDAVRRLDSDEFDSVEVTDALGRKQPSYIVNEPGLYSLILGSRKPEARAFKRWVTHEILPAIRQSGSYAFQQPQSIEDLIILQAQSMKELRSKVQEIDVQLQIHSHRIDNLDRIDINGDEQQRLVAMVKRYAHQEGVTWDKAWKDFTDRFNTAYNTNLKLRIENYKDKHGLQALTRPQYLSLVGQLQDAIRVADKMLNRVPAGV